MKVVWRVVIGVLGIIAIVFGVRQVMSGVREISGKAPETQPQKLGGTFTSDEGGFSFRIPEGWQTKPAARPGMTMIVAPQESGYSANMTVSIESFDGTVRDYADANKTSVVGTFPDAVVLSDTAFVPATNAASYKVTFQNRMKDVDLRQLMYFFAGPAGKKIVVTTTATAAQGPELEPLFDGCMKTLALAHP